MFKKLSIKSIVQNQLRESEEKPFFYLAPDIIGSINNAYPQKGKNIFVIDFNTTDNRNLKLAVPNSCYKNWSSSNTVNHKDKIKQFLMNFLDGANVVNQEGNDMLDEIVDEDGNIPGDNEDRPPDIKGSPGYGNRKDIGSGRKQYISQYTRMISPLGYGGVVW